MCWGMGGGPDECPEPLGVLPPGEGEITASQVLGLVEGTVSVSDDELVIIDYTDDLGRLIRVRYARVD